MKIFANLKIWKKIVIIFAIITSVSFAAPKPVAAGIGGELMKPVCELLIAIGDGVMGIIHKALIHEDVTMISITVDDGGVLGVIKKVLISAAVCVGIAAAIALSGGILGAVMGAASSAVSAAVTGVAASAGASAGAAGILGAVGSIILKIGVAGVVTGVVLGHVDLFPDKRVDLPLFVITPEEIFSNNQKFPIFNVNFINPPQETYEREYTAEVVMGGENDGEPVNNEDTISQNFPEETVSNVADWVKSDLNYTNIKDKPEKFADAIGIDKNTISQLLQDNNKTSLNDVEISNLKENIINLEASDTHEVQNTVANIEGVQNRKIAYYSKYNDDVMLRLEEEVEETATGTTIKKYEVSYAKIKKKYKSENIQKEEVKEENSAHFTSTGEKVQTHTVTQTESIHTISYELSKFVSSTYYRLRMIAIVGMMSVLIYIGIRILLSSAAPQKAKYKELLGDWFVGMVLLFTMHYIMIFANLFVDELSRFLNQNNPQLQTAVITGSEDQLNKIQEGLEKYGYTCVDSEEKVDKSGMTLLRNENGIFWPTNLMGAARFYARYNAYEDSTAFIGFTLIYLVLVIYTVTFIFTYLKRIVYMAFLTLISPLVALTYPIDKVTDGKAQGFNYWFKEYIFNLLLQPLHLLIYTILVSAALEFVATNWLYSLVALGFVASAEKIVRQMFNFQKAHTPGLLAGPAGAALTFSGMKWLFGHKLPQRGQNGGQKSIGGSNDSDSSGGSGKPINFHELGNGLKLGEGENQDEGNPILGEKEPPSNTEDESKTKMQSKLQPQSSIRQVGHVPKEGDDDYDPTGSLSDEIIWGRMLNSSRGKRYDQLRYANDEQRQHMIDEYKKEQKQKYDNKLARKKKIKSVKTGLGDALSYYNDKQNRKTKEIWKNARPLKTTARAVGGLAAGVTFGAAGLAAGVVSGDPSKAAQYTTLGAIGGAKMASSGIGYVADQVRENFAGTKEAYDRSRLGKEKYKEKQNKKRYKEFIQNEDNIKKVQEKNNMSRVEAKNWLNNNAEEYLNEGVDNIGDMLNIEDAIGKEFSYYDDNSKLKNGKISDRQTAIGAHKLSKQFNTEHVYGDKKQEAIIQEIANMPGVDSSRARGMFYAAKTVDDVRNKRYDPKAGPRGSRRIVTQPEKQINNTPTNSEQVSFKGPGGTEFRTFNDPEGQFKNRESIQNPDTTVTPEGKNGNNGKIVLP